jgi:glucosamine-phosphate N-acetyltransferase
LTIVGDVKQEDFEKRFDLLHPRMKDIYKIVVIVDTQKDKIIGSGTIFMEYKFIRHCGIVRFCVF